jgi:hypothetical protein
MVRIARVSMPLFCACARGSRRRPGRWCHDQRIAAQQLQVVGDVRRAAAELGAQGRHQEGDVHAVQLVGQQGFAEAAVVLHDLVEGERAADQGLGHGGS